MFFGYFDEISLENAGFPLAFCELFLYNDFEISTWEEYGLWVS